jgi:hypothetical protein
VPDPKRGFGDLDQGRSLLFLSQEEFYLLLLVPPAGTNLSYQGIILYIFYDAELYRKEGSVNVKVDVARDGALGICYQKSRPVDFSYF